MEVNRGNHKHRSKDTDNKLPVSLSTVYIMNTPRDENPQAK